MIRMCAGSDGIGNGSLGTLVRASRAAACRIGGFDIECNAASEQKSSPHPLASQPERERKRMVGEVLV
jgi:hypothetical protein